MHYFANDGFTQLGFEKFKCVKCGLVIFRNSMWHPRQNVILIIREQEKYGTKLAKDISCDQVIMTEALE